MRSIESSGFKNAVAKIHGNNIELLESYTNSRTKINSKCGVCGHTWLANPRPLLKGVGCPQCGKIKAAKTIKWKKAPDEFAGKVKAIHGNKFSILSEYESVHGNIKVFCNDCKNTLTTKPLYLLKEQYGGCEFCGRIKKGIASRIQHDVFKARIKQINPEIEILGTYTTGRNRITVRCRRCKHIWEPRAAGLTKRGCPLCPSSKGEKRIKELLKSSRVKFKTQHTFNDLIGRRGQKFKFDFAVFENGEVKYLIEYDGEQHFRPVKIWGGMRKLERQRQIDNLKNEYCKIKGIRLIRISARPEK